MANNIALAQTYVALLDEVYQHASLTAKLDGASQLVQQGANANELVIPKMSMDGLGDYSRNGGYVSGDVSLTNQTVTCNFDRGRMFSVDTLDDQETAGLAYGRLAGEFIRTKVVPEEDAFRFACYAGASGISVATPTTLTTGAAVVAALRVAQTTMDEAEVPYEDRHLFITAILKGLVDDMDTTSSREVLAGFSSVTKVPQSRFYTAISQLDGSSTGETAGGYTKGSSGLDINFMVIHKPAVIQFAKHVAPKIVTPDQNQTSDGHKFGYRKVSIAEIYDNKVAGIYLHHKAAVVSG